MCCAALPLGSPAGWALVDLPAEKLNITTQSTGRAKGGEIESHEALPYGGGKERPRCYLHRQQLPKISEAAAAQCQT